MPNTLQKIICLIVLLSSFMNIASSSASLMPIEKPMITPMVSPDVYKDIINSLIDHINGDDLLTDSDFINNNDLLDQNMVALSTDMESISKSFELIELFEDTYGALFTTSNTQNGFNRQYTADGLNLHRNIISIHQGLIDHSYTKEWLLDNSNLLEGKIFQTSQYFPGFVDAPEDTDVIENATVKCSYLLASGSQAWANIGNPNVVRPTGCYLAPGSIAEITVPESLIGKGIKIRVGAHFWNLENKNSYKRLDRVSITYDVNEVKIKIAHPLGGGIYMEIPLGVDEGLLGIELKNVVRSPFYSKKTFHETSLSDWLEVERKHTAPWTDFETDKFMMQVPTSWIYEFEDPKTLLEAWDKSMDAVSDLLGRPRITDRHKNYLQFDVVIRGNAYHPEYPMSNTPYNPNASTDGLPQHKILEGPQFDQDIHFHELGHEVAISKFVGETEALVNFLYVPVLNKCFDYSLDEAFQKSFGPSYNYTSTKDNTIRTRLVADTFDEGLPRNTCGCTKNEVRYQHRGYAHYVDIVDLFGWEALEKFWKSESDAADAGMPFPVNNQPQDDRIFRMSQAAGVDLRPLFHFWGIHPNNQEELAQRMQDNNLTLPMSIKAKLHQYRNLIPSNNEFFVEFGNELYPNFLDYSGNQFDFGAGWYQTAAETFDEAKASEIEQALSDIIIFYYGSDCFELEEFLTPEFSIPTQYCKGNELNILPTTSDNGINGSWSSIEIDASEIGLFEYTFLPDLDQCSEESSLIIEVNNTTASIIGSTALCNGSTTTLTTAPIHETYSWVLDGLVMSESQSVDISQAGVLILLVTDDNGCQAESEVLIEVFGPMDISVEVTAPVCYGDYGSAIFTSSDESGDDYTYSIDGDSLTSGIYDVVVTDDLGCTASFVFEVTQPDPIVIDIDGDLINITGGTAPFSVITDVSGNIQTVTVTDANGCQSTAEFVVTSISDQSIDDIRIYPNPATTEVYIDLSGVNSKVESLQLISLNGKLIRSYSKNDLVIDVSGLNDGVHILQIVFENGVRICKRVMVLR